MIKTLQLALAALAMALGLPAAMAQSANDYPNRPIRFIAPIPAGGSTDVLTRDIARRLQERWGQPTVVENKPGSTGSIGAALVARAPADGYTLLLVNSGHVINEFVYAKLPYDPIKDFVPVVHAASIAMGLFVHPLVPAKNLPEFLALARSKPGALSFATSGNGGAGHLGGESIKAATGIDMVHVPYRGSAPALADVVAGQVPVSIADVPLARPHVRSGALRPIALAAAQRSAALPDMPTFAELARRPEPRLLGLGRFSGSGRHPQGDRRQAQPRDRLHRARARDGRPPARNRFRGGWQHAGRVRADDED